MRRTQQEFKAEIFRRSSAYRQRRKETQMKLLTGLACVALVILGIGMLPRGFAGGAVNSADQIMESLQAAPAEASAAGIQEETQEVYTVASAVCVESISDGTKKNLGLGEGDRLAGFLANTEWLTMRHQCTPEYVITDAWGKHYGYHPDCGAVYDPQTGLHSEPLPEDVQEILDKYCN